MDRKKLVEDFRDGQMDRRSFVLKALGLGIGLTTVAKVLTACSGEEQKPPPKAEPPKTEAPKAEAPKTDAPPADDLGPMETELRIYSWSDYIAEDTVPNFEKEFNIKVIYDTYESNEELIAKLQAGAAGYDLVCPSGYAVEILQKLDLLDKLRPAHIPNLKNIDPTFRGPVYDPKNEYAVPWAWGMSGIAFRKDKIKAPIDSWAVFHDKQYSGRMTQMDDPREAIGAWLRFRGKSANSVVPEEMAQAKADAIQAKKNLQSYISAPVKGSLIAGDVWIAQLWDGDTNQAKAESDKIDWVLPKEGSIIWTDSMVIPKTAPHKRAAHAFLDYVLRPEVGAAIASFHGYGTANAAAMAKMESPVQFPSPEKLKTLEWNRDLGDKSALWDQIWTEIKAA